MVRQAPVCTYAHVREGGHAFAERVKKKNGTKWDRDQRGAPSWVDSSRRGKSTAARISMARRTRKKNASLRAFLLAVLSAILKRIAHVLVET